MNPTFKFLAFTFRILASQQLAIILLSSLALSLAAGTFVESAHGAKAAQQVIYFSLWFNILLLLIGLNVTLVTFTRLPWKKKHIGFLLTHLGIILILFGSLITARNMVDGMIAIAEGEKTSRVVLDDPLIAIQTPGKKSEAIAPISRKPFEWEGKEKLPVFGEAEIGVNQLAFYPHAKSIEKVIPTENGNPSLHISLFNDFTQTEGWLLLGDNEKELMNLGPAVIRIASTPFSEKKPSSKGNIVLSVDNKRVSIALEEAMKKPTLIPGTPYTLEVLRYLPHAIVENGKLITKSQEPLNPACELVIKGNKVIENHTAFANFPKFTTKHGASPSQTDLNIIFESSEAKQQSFPNELRIIYDANKKLWYQIKSKSGITEPEKLDINKEYDTGWMGLKFFVDQFEESALLISTFKSLPNPTGGKRAEWATLLEFNKGEESEQLWFTQGDKKIFLLKESAFRISAGSLTQPLGFELSLKKFIVEYYQGTNKPAAFKSEVVMKDNSEGIYKEQLISMNEPLIYNGLRVYQSGYQLGKGDEPTISIFTVSRDPGIPIKYAGSIILIIGITTIFFIRKFSNPKPLYNGEN